MRTKQLRETRKIELVETHNIALSLDRLNIDSYDEGPRKRALYHALCMTISFSCAAREKIRIALELP